MAELTTKTAGLKIDGFFKKPVLFKDAHCDETAQKSLDSFSSYGLKSSQISLRAGDEAYNYDVSFSLFNGNATFMQPQFLRRPGINISPDLPMPPRE